MRPGRRCQQFRLPQSVRRLQQLDFGAASLFCAEYRCLALDSESRTGMLPRNEVPFLDGWHRYKFVASRVLFTVPLVGPNRSGLPSPQIEIERR